ncbi:MAG: hypothetical protein Q9187_002335 [Circinaria calcarea]
MTNLQQSGTELDPKYKFSTHFCHRLNQCLNDLKTFEVKIGKIDARFGVKKSCKRDWDGKARRSWERVRWLLIGEQETRKFLEKVKLYQNEFFLELLMLLTTINGSPTPSMVPPESVITASALAPSSSSVAGAPRLSQSLPFYEYPATGTPHSPGPLGHCAKSSDVAILGVPASFSPSSSIRVTFIQRWSFLFCDFALRLGPAIMPNLNRKQQARFPPHYRQTGFGLGLSLSLSKLCRRRLDIALYLVQASFLSRVRLTFYWDIDCPRTIPRSAEIMRCVEEGSVEGVQRMLGAGRATSRDVTIHGTTLLHLASKTRNIELIRLLIQEGGDLNAQDGDGDTPLHWAMARKGNYDTVRLLIENGADLANNTVDGRTPLHTFFSDTVEKVLLRDDWIEVTFPDSQGMSITHFLAWSSKSTPELFERGIAHDSADLWSVDGFGRTCLHLAASRGNVSLLRYLLERASSTEVQRADNKGRTALHYAVQSKRLETIDLLHANGEDLHAKDNSSQTVLHCAARWGNLAAARKIVALGDSEILLSPDENGNMPSDLARGLKATVLRESLAGLELAAKSGTDSHKGNPLYQSSSTGKRSDTKHIALSPVRLWGNLITLGILIFSFPEWRSVRDPMAAIALAVVSILYLSIRTTQHPS